MSAFARFRKAVTVKRPPSGAYVDGVWTQGASTTMEVLASIQPAKDEDLKSLPEARRLQRAYRLYADVKLQSIKENANNPDIVVIDGEDYEIADCEHWQNGIIPHYKALAVRVQTS